MSSDTDHPRQRTVAELLAAHGGDAAASGRRRRRREADDGEGGASVEQTVSALSVRELAHRAPPPVPPQVSQPLPVPVSAPRWNPQPVAAPVRREVPPRVSPPAPQPGPPPAPPPAAFRSRPGEPVRDRPTDVIPRVRETERPADPAGAGRGADPDDDGGPATMVGAAPVGAEAWHEVRTREHRGGTALDGGPALPLGPGAPPAGLGGRPGLDDELRGYDDHLDDEFTEDGYADDGFAEHDEDDEFDAPPSRQRRGREGAGASAWSAVIVQWIAGALGGAVLWVAFRFLWRNLPVVALAASAIVTIGLVLIVRALLHNDDRRTTVFAVLVGLLLTVSPAILVLLGR